MKKRFSNSKGEVFYGMHMYPGVCEYTDPKTGQNFRVFLNENTIRDMDRTFPGKPLYVDHVPEVPEDIDEMKEEADGYVVDSFYNAADGKHWCKFVVVTSKGLSAIQQGYRLSNTYNAEAYDKGGRWNHVPYQKQITAAEYEHLALVQSPRYDESVVLTPEEFKAYNERHESDLKRFANEKDDEMKLDFFKREKMSNSSDFAGVSVLLPKSGKEYTITRLVNAMDEVEVKSKEAPTLDMSLRLKVGESEMTVEELKSAYEALVLKVQELDEEIDEELDDEEDDEDEDSFDNDDEEDSFDNEDEDEEKTPPKKMKNKADDEDLASKKKKADEAKKDKKQNSLSAKERADRLRDAKRQHRMENSSVSKVETRGDQIARGLARYGR